MKEIKLTQGKTTLLDDSDFKKFAGLSWYAWESHGSGRFYAIRSEGNKKIALAREVLGVSDPRIKVDHINHNTLDNRHCNLRACSNTENIRNRFGCQKNSTSRKRGVTWHKQLGQWQSQIMVDGRNVYLGVFRSKKEASLAYAIANRKYFGVFGGKP